MRAVTSSVGPWLLFLAAGFGCSSSSTTTGGAADGGSSKDAGGTAHDGATSPGHPDGTTATDAGHTVDAEGAEEAGAAHDAGHLVDASHTNDAPQITGDSGADASSSDRVPLLGACVGTSMALTVYAQTPYANVPVGSESGEFALDFGSTFSSIDLSAFAAPGPTTSDCDTADLGETCTVAGFAFFASPSSVDLVTEDFSGLGGTLRQAGIIGTDLLSAHVITIDYAASTVYASTSSTFCSSSALTTAGFVPLTVAGFYENDPTLLKPATDVDSADSSADSVPNVPTVPVAVAGAAAIAQLDTGFDDDVTPFSVNINKAFYAAIVAANATALVRAAALDETLSTCVNGVSESAKAYTLASGVTFDFTGTGGATARAYGQAVMFVKDTPSAAATCGGIGTWTVPAAQVGASFYIDMKGLVFDPFGAKVWVPLQ